MPKQRFSVTARLLLAALLLTGLLAFSTRPALANVYVVTTFADTDDGFCNADCSLREALAVANLNSGLDTILLEAGTYTITTSDVLTINSPVEIIGKGSDLTTITYGGTLPGVRLSVGMHNATTLNGLTILGGSLTFSAITCFASPLTLQDVRVSASSTTGAGGALSLYDCPATLTDSRLTGNTASAEGGAIYLHALTPSNNTLTLINSTISGNTSGGCGGGLFINNAPVVIHNSTLSDNTSVNGGALCLQQDISSPYKASLALNNRLISDNSASGSGGGIYLDSLLSAAIQNSTISQNQADANGGGIWVRGSATITHCTIANNAADHNNDQGGWHGAGLYTADPSLTVRHAILGDNYDNANTDTKSDCLVTGSGVFTSLGYNLVEQPVNCAVVPLDIQYQDALLSPLADHGGPTLTYGLQSGSPAVNAGDPTFVPPPDFDQRGPGYPRVLFGRLDIGATEAGLACYLPLVSR